MAKQKTKGDKISMKKSLHTKSVNGCNLLTTLGIAEKSGFSGVEIAHQN